MAKKINSIVGAISALVISLGCSPAVDVSMNARQVKDISQDTSWFKRDPSQVYEQFGMVYAIGTNRSSNQSLARIAAESDARQKLARHLSGKENYEMSLKNSRVFSYKDTGGEIRCLVGMPYPGI